MKRFSSSVLIFCLLFLSGCATFHKPKVETQNQQKIEKAENRLTATSDKIRDNNNKKNNETAILATGIQYSLNQIEEPSREVETAQKLNERIVSIVGTPNLNESEKIKQTINLLNSEIEAERKKGEVLLKEKDVEIVYLQNQKDQLEQQYAINIADITNKAKAMAEQADLNQSVIDDVNKWFGLGAIFYGLKTFVKTAFIGILIFGVVFFILRVFAVTNPAIGALFAVFDVIGGWLVNFIRVITPNAHKTAKIVDSFFFDRYKQTLVKLIQVIQKIKDKTIDANSDGKIDIQEVRTFITQMFNEQDEEVVKEIRKEFNVK